MQVVEIVSAFLSKLWKMVDNPDFVRQLNMYGFRKVVSVEKEEIESHL